MVTNIRTAVLADIPNILPMIAKICEFHCSHDQARYDFLPDAEQLYPSWVQGLIKDKRDLCLVAEAPSGQLVAFLLATVEKEVPVYRLKQYGYIHDLWVEAEYRRAGLARQLVMQAVEHFRQLGIPQVRLDTLIDNESALKLYRNCGFRESTIEMLIELSEFDQPN
jgi:ribosomal protein S18 acetylase RimI-like enzyme